MNSRAKVLLVTDQLPGHHIGLEKSGSAHYVTSFITHFQRRGLEVVIVLLRPRLDFVIRRTADFPYRVISPHLREFAGRIVPNSPKPALATLAWKAYSKLPPLVQSGISTVRLRAREARGFVHELGRFPSPEERRFARTVAEREQPDLVLYDGLFNSCGRLCAASHWLISHDVKHERAASFAKRGFNVLPSGFDEAAERSLVSEIGNVIAIQWDEAAAFKELAPGCRVVVVPAPFEPPARKQGSPVPFRCAFVGSGSFHNVNGVEWFLANCWPAVRRAIPQASLDIFGSVCVRLGHVPDGVNLRGVVDDLGTAYASAAAVVVPLQVGSGLKIKLVEALVYGCPVVTTSVGAQGLMGIEPRPFLLADPPERFSAEIVRLLQTPDLAASLRAASCRAAELFEPAAAFSEFDAAAGLLESVKLAS